MQLTTLTSTPSDVDAPLLVVPVTVEMITATPEALSRLDTQTGGRLATAIRLGDFRGKTGDRASALSPTEGSGPARVLYLGVGEATELDMDGIRSVGGNAIKAAESHRLAEVTVALSHLDGVSTRDWGQAIAEGLTLAAWRYEEQQADDPDRAPRVERGSVLVTEEDGWGAGVAVGSAIARGENRTRTLQARPGNVATPTHLAEEARAIADDVGLSVQILGPEEMRAESMDALLSVAQGSDEEPRLIVLRHQGAGDDSQPIILVGKGLTFDAGGISIKPAAGMEEMKYDMSGGAAVLGAMLAIGQIKPSLNVVGIVPSSENLINGSATKPGDVIGSRAGKTIEVINTDAEGRLILADALSYATDMNPAAVVDCATLTGSCVIALGHHNAALMGNDDDLLAELQAAGERASEPCWPLPMGPLYRKQLDSEFADLKNVGGRPGGSITAACFLAEFVGDAPWAHLDIAGTAYGDTSKAYLKKGPLGAPCRMLVEWVLSRASA